MPALAPPASVCVLCAAVNTFVQVCDNKIERLETFYRYSAGPCLRKAKKVQLIAAAGLGYAVLINSSCRLGFFSSFPPIQ